MVNSQPLKKELVTWAICKLPMLKVLNGHETSHRLKMCNMSVKQYNVATFDDTFVLHRTNC